ncbi:hypothetical protein CASFOL_025285 [Castilleja foliolosa]|uniref:PGG domain-containing protein n=1 Tax=Castilleja foliolosa TaxID=1961234 RepID=A0ABD3CQP4_9LAMI
MSMPKYLDNYETMDPKLYRATTQGDILEFVRALEETLDRPHSLIASCVQLGPQKNTFLHIATGFAHYEIVKLICMDLPFLVAEKNAKGDTALHIAARAGDPLLVTFLINSDFNGSGLLGERNVEGNTALHEALKNSHKEVAQILIYKNRDMNYSANKKGESLLYLAAEAGFVTVVRLLMDNPVGNCCVGRKYKTKSPVFAAILGSHIDVIKLLWEKDPSSFHLRNSKGENPLHVAVCMGFTEGVKFILEKHYEFAYQGDKQGFYPIHSASEKGLIDIIKLMLQYRPDVRELLTSHGQNMMHAAARCGKDKAVKYMLKMPELEKLINEKDKNGNTPLHLATIYGHPKTVGILVRDERVILKLVNNDHQTALDIAEEHMETGSASFQKRLTCMALKVAGAPRSSQPKIFKGIAVKHKNQPESEAWRDKINVLLVVSTIIATVTFNAGFTIPGDSNPNQGASTTMLENMKFREYIICTTIALYSSIIVATTLIWAQLGDPSYTQCALKLALLLLGIALSMMSIAFLAGVYLVVRRLWWLANVVLVIGSGFTIALVVIFVPLCFLSLSNNQIFKSISYYPLYLVVYTLGN